MGTASIIFWIIVAFFCWRGYQKGFIKSISRLLSLIIPYPCAIFFYKPVAKMLIKKKAGLKIILYFYPMNLLKGKKLLFFLSMKIKN